MGKFFSGFWHFITAPFRFIGKLVSLPFKAFRKLHAFFTEEPDDSPLVDVFSNVVSDKEVQQSIWDHVDALRKHLLHILIGLSVTVIASFAFADKLLAYLAGPLPNGIDSLRAIEVTESIGVFMRVSLMTGLAAALPYIAFELWLFVAPGLRPRSRLFGLIAIPLAFILFLAGMAFAYYVMLPAALPFLLNFANITTEPQAKSYYGFVIGVMFWIGVSFEFPLVVYVLTSIGFIKPHVLLKQWRIAIVLIAILAAAITPTVDPVNMGLVMAPMIVLYFISIGLSFLAYRDQTNQQTAGA